MYRSPRDLKGMKIGVTVPGSSTNIFVNHLLASAGLSPDDASIIGVGTGPTAVAAGFPRGKRGETTTTPSQTVHTAPGKASPRAARRLALEAKREATNWHATLRAKRTTFHNFGIQEVTRRDVVFHSHFEEEAHRLLECDVLDQDAAELPDIPYHEGTFARMSFVPVFTKLRTLRSVGERAMVLGRAALVSPDDLCVEHVAGYAGRYMNPRPAKKWFLSARLEAKLDSPVCYIL
jgi:hypothetical protein